MKKEDFIKGITYLAVAYGKDLTKETMGVWYDFFKDTNYEVFRQAIKRIIPKSQFMPSIADLKKEIIEIKAKDFPDAEDEWNLVIDLVHKYGSYNVEKAMNEMKPYTRYITSLVGFINICMASDQTWNKKNFIEEYNIMKDRDLEYLQIGENAKKIEEIELLELKDV